MGKGIVLTCACVLTVLLAASCRESAPPGSVGQFESSAICLKCQTRTTLRLASEASREPWPKVCASCKKWAVYACQDCPHCGAPVVLRDERIDGFGRPERCPHCGKPLSPAPAATRPG